MAFFLAPLPSTKKEWITTLILCAIAFLFIFFIIKPTWNQVATTYNFFFWIGFYLFWAFVVYLIIKWIAMKIHYLFNKRKIQEEILKDFGYIQP